jgi:hypothetical protein
MASNHWYLSISLLSWLTGSLLQEDYTQIYIALSKTEETAQRQDPLLSML